MTLRAINNPLSELVILPQLVPILPVGTQLAAGSGSKTGTEQIYVQQYYQMCQGAFPAVLLSSGLLKTEEVTPHARAGTYTIVVQYYDRWDMQTLPLLVIRTNIMAELDRMQANLETYLKNNEGFVGADGVMYPADIVGDMQKDEFDQATDRYGLGMTLGSAALHVTLSVFPYGV